MPSNIKVMFKKLNALSRDKRSERAPVLPRQQPPTRRAHAGALTRATVSLEVSRPVVRLVEVDMIPAWLKAIALGLRSVVDEHIATDEGLVPRQDEPVDPRLVRVRVGVWVRLELGLGLGLGLGGVGVGVANPNPNQGSTHAWPR